MASNLKGAIIGALLLHSTVVIADPVTDFCNSLKSRLGPGSVIQQGSTAYSNASKDYFTNQEANIKPACFVQPAAAQDVSTVIKEINSARSGTQNYGDNAIKFAIKSGGHTTWAGSANIQGGVTIDLKKLNAVDVASSKTTTSIGPGARWRDVYGKLDTMGLTVVGGRVAQVGVGGLLIGGGISFISPKQGLSCDNVVDFEIVLADGQIVHANKDQNRDLWIALKGGSNNFGIVTRYTVKTFQQGKLWGGITLLSTNLTDSQLDAFHNFTANPNYDENANLIQSFDYFSASNALDISNSMHYTLPVANPPALKPFWSAPNQYSTLRTASLLDLTTELGAFAQNGRYDLFTTITFKSDPTLLKKVHSLYNDTIPGLSSVQNLFWGIVFQPLPPAITGKTQKNGPDPLGLDGSPPLVNVLISSSWDLDSDTAHIEQTARKLVQDIDAAARSMGLNDDYIYLNYALKGQEPFAGYGAQNKAFLQDVSRKYDPRGFFQTVCPGGFKVFP